MFHIFLTSNWMHYKLVKVASKINVTWSDCKTAIKASSHKQFLPAIVTEAQSRCPAKAIH